MTGGNGVSDLHTFLAKHKLQLEGAGVPSIYWDCLHTKLTRPPERAWKTPMLPCDWPMMIWVRMR